MVYLNLDPRKYQDTTKPKFIASVIYDGWLGAFPLPPLSNCYCSFYFLKKVYF